MVTIFRFGPVYINGRAYSRDEAVLSIFDRGLLYGDGLFETIRARNDKPFRLAEHLERMRNGMRILRMGIEPNALDLAGSVQSAIDASGFPEGRVRLCVTRGTYTGSYAAHKAEKPTVIVTVQDITGVRRPEPVEVMVSSFRRDEANPLSRAKTLNYLPSVLARAEAGDAGASDAIMLNTLGRVAEASSSNLFMVKDSKLVTPDVESGILPGVTRAMVLMLARDLKLPVEERPVDPAELAQAEELFLTNAITGIFPIIKLDGKLVGSGDHEFAGLLAEAYANLFASETA